MLLLSITEIYSLVQSTIMATEENVQILSWTSVTRIEALTDGIYAIAMTLLVLSIELPQLPRETSFMLWQAFKQEWPLFSHYALSFIILASFWTVHHIQFHYIKRADRALLWINFVCLMFIVLLPFSTSLKADYDNILLAAIFFHCNMLLIGIIFFINWQHATRHHRLVAANLDNHFIQGNLRTSLVIPAFSIIALCISFLSPHWSSAPYILIPFTVFGIKKQLHKKHLNPSTT